MIGWKLWRKETRKDFDKAYSLRCMLHWRRERNTILRAKARLRALLNVSNDESWVAAFAAELDKAKRIAEDNAYKKFLSRLS